MLRKTLLLMYLGNHLHRITENDTDPKKVAKIFRFDFAWKQK